MAYDVFIGNGLVYSTTDASRQPFSLTANETATAHGILRLWTRRCSMRMQAVLTGAVRGCDGRSKYDASKPLVWALRYDVLLPSSRDLQADPTKFSSFMGYRPNLEEKAQEFLEDLDGYPFHFIQHLAHASHILAVFHDSEDRRQFWRKMYEGIIREGFHCQPETDFDMCYRLRDR